MEKAHPLIEFGEHMMTCGGYIDFGEAWSREYGWRLYMRVHKKMFVMSPRMMRELGEKYRDAPDVPQEIKDRGLRMIERAAAAKWKDDRLSLLMMPA